MGGRVSLELGGLEGYRYAQMGSQDGTATYFMYQ